MPRLRPSSRAAGILAIAALPLLLAATTWAVDPTLTVRGSAAPRSGPATFSLHLADDATAAAVSADVDVRLPAEVDFEPPVAMRCAVAPRLEGTHRVAGQVLEPGLVAVAILARALDVEPLGDGELATCTLAVRADATRPIAPLAVEFAGLGDSDGLELPRIVRSGAIVVSDLPLCAGDCSENAAVSIDEIIRGVSIALGFATADTCRPLDTNGDAAVSIAEIISAVNSALFGC